MKKPQHSIFKSGAHCASMSQVTLLTILMLTLSGCAQFSRSRQLKSVARNWFETIRASQVIPVYPMTEDLQPGDIYLVQVPVDKQQKLWKKGKYMPLDNHMARINPTGYWEFYKKSFLNDPETLPKDWRNGPPPEENKSEGNGDGEPAGAPVRSTAWSQAPGASFPSYTFKIKRGGGANTLVPISSVPTGLSLLGTDQAQVTVIIRDARTLGVDMVSLHKQLRGWWSENQLLLKNFEAATDKDPHNYIRIITRIYLAGQMDVSIQSSASFAAGVDVGAPRPVELLFNSPPAVPGQTSTGGDNASEGEAQGSGAAEPNAGIDDLGDNLTKLNKVLAAEKVTKVVDGASQIVPGSSVRVTMAGGRAISLNETFDPPLVLGYLGFDVPILKGGGMGPPIPTHSLLNKFSKPAFDRQSIDIAAAQFDRVISHPQKKAIAQKVANDMGSDWGQLWKVLTKDAAGDEIDERFGDFCLAYVNASGTQEKNNQILRLNEFIDKAISDVNAQSEKAEANPSG